MTGPIVVDVGNTRIKWGRCEAGRVVEVAALPPNAPRTWREQCSRWGVLAKTAWIVSGVHPQRQQLFIEWLCSIGFDPIFLNTHDRTLPLQMWVTEPQKVGIDRRLNAIAVNTRRPAGTLAIIVDAGSAVTVDLVDESGVFRGGAIFPGLRLMAQSLHEHTALLPLVTIDHAEGPPGPSTEQAIRIGVFHAVLGGIERLIAGYCTHATAQCHTHLTGGDANILLGVNSNLGELWPEMTLEGILHSVPELASHA